MTHYYELREVEQPPMEGESSKSKQTNLNEKSGLIQRHYSPLPKPMTDVKYLHKGILLVSWFSVVLLGILATVTLVFAFRDGSSSCFAFSLDAFLDVLSSLVVIRRFTGDDGGLSSRRKEALACITLGVLFLFSALSIFTYSVFSLTTNLFPLVEDAIFIVFSINGAACTFLMVAKFYLGVKLKSKSIITDAVNSLIGGLLAFASIIGDTIYETNEAGWVIDPSVGIVCSALLFAYGVWIIVLSVDEFKEVEREIAGGVKHSQS